MSKGRINLKQKQSRIPESAVEVKYEKRSAVCFHHMMDTVEPLEHLSKEWIVQMLKQFKVLGGISWDEIAKYGGLGWDCVPQHRMKYQIPKSLGRTELYHIKISGKSRVWGFREGDSFQLVWFDPEHKVTPE
jgi:hypothetical protein